MSTALVASLISALSAFLIAVAGYVFTKRAERESEWRKEKVAYYKEFVSSLSGAIETETTPEGQIRFARACNNVLLFAPQDVIKALEQFHEEIRVTNPSKSGDRHNLLLSELFFAIRRDIGVKPKDTRVSFRIHLWSSGVSTAREKADA